MVNPLIIKEEYKKLDGLDYEDIWSFPPVGLHIKKLLKNFLQHKRVGGIKSYRKRLIKLVATLLARKGIKECPYNIIEKIIDQYFLVDMQGRKSYEMLLATCYFIMTKHGFECESLVENRVVNRYIDYIAKLKKDREFQYNIRFDVVHQLRSKLKYGIITDGAYKKAKELYFELSKRGTDFKGKQAKAIAATLVYMVKDKVKLKIKQKELLDKFEVSNFALWDNLKEYEAIRGKK